MKKQEFKSVLREVIKEELHEWDEPGIDFGGDGYSNEFQRAYAHSQATTPRHNDTKKAIEMARKGKFVVIVSDDVHCRSTDALLGQCVSIHKVFDNINDAQTEAEKLWKSGQDVNLITPDSVKKMDEPEQPEALEPGDDVPFQESDDVDQLDDEPEGSYDPESPEFDWKKYGGSKPRPGDYKEGYGHVYTKDIKKDPKHTTNKVTGKVNRWTVKFNENITKNQCKGIIKELINEMWADMGNLSGDTQKDGPTGRATEPGSDADLVDLYKGGKPDSIGGLPSVGGAMSENEQLDREWDPKPIPQNASEIADLIFRLKEGTEISFFSHPQSIASSEWEAVQKVASGDYFTYRVIGAGGKGKAHMELEEDEDVSRYAQEILDARRIYKYYNINSIADYTPRRRYDHDAADQAIGDYEKYGADPVRWQDVTEGPEYEKWLKNYKGEKCPKCGEFHPAGEGGMKVLNPSNPTVNQCGKCKHKWNPDNKTTKPLYEAKGMTSKQKLRSIITESIQEVLKEYSERDEKQAINSIASLARTAVSRTSAMPPEEALRVLKEIDRLAEILVNMHKDKESGKGYDVPVNVKERTALGVTQETISKTKNLLDDMFAARKKK